ncbi:WAT1-related protein At3g18200 [Dendrobium catenatum]|uniref:WAT1-related protein At3g18200 n=1 Tax=Dendrobium catenatum TaxID=906689 RepID=UPI0009F66942|nr:WAT1-related protein At3g18200 [Dendrobium catenatum]
MGRESQFSKKLKLLITVFLLHLCYAGSHIVSRVALNMGISKLLLLVYRNIIAVVLLAPFAYFLEKNDRPPLTFSILIELFLLALCGIAANQGSYILGLYYLSPTYVSAIQNSTPAITFAMAAALRLEQLNIKKRYGIAKVMGTAVCISGATILTLYKGSPLLKNHLNLTVLGKSFISSSQIMHWTLGCVYILLNCVAWSGWMVFQVPVLKHYPARLSVTTLTCFFGVIQFIVIAAFTERDVERWKIHSGEELLAVLYAGLVGSGITFSLQTWCIDRAGPLIVAIFQPVQTVLVAILAAIILGDQLYSGGLIGFIIIMVGLYSVLWGKNEENKVGKLETEDLTNHLLEQQ